MPTAGALVHSPRPRRPRRLRLGMNIGVPTDWNTHVLTKDRMKQARSWSPPPLTVDGNGWPTALPSSGSTRTMLFNAIDGHYPTGPHVCVYAGKGSLSFTGATVTSAAPGRYELDVTAPGTSKGVTVSIVFIDPADPIRDVELFPAADEASRRSRPWNRTFLQHASPFSPLRAMDLLKTNGSAVTTWDTRASPTWFTQSTFGNERGMSYEFVLDLANALHVDPYITVPHGADDDHFDRLLALIAEKLDPRLKAWLAYTNEAWNDQFPQAAYCKAEGLKLWPTIGAVAAGLRFQSARSKVLFLKAEQVLGLNRIRRVVEGQISAAQNNRTHLLGWNGLAELTDDYHTAPYFAGRAVTPNVLAATPPATVDEFFDRTFADLGTLGALLTQSAELAEEFGINAGAYEFGNAAVAKGAWHTPAVETIIDEAQTHPRMFELYSTVLEMMDENDFATACHYQLHYPHTDKGDWGALRYMDDVPADQPKYAALCTWARRGPLPFYGY